MLAKGKLIINANNTFSFEQINERCDEKCQINADKYLENVTALWMVERIRHRDNSGNSHRYDLKFTIVPIYHDQKHQVDHNILENRLKHHMKRTFLLRDSDYPHFFNSVDNRRTDLFSPNIDRSLSGFMNMNPNNLMQNFFGMVPVPQKASHKRDGRLNTGEFYMGPKVQNSLKTNFIPTINGHASNFKDQRVQFPDSREMIMNNHHQHPAMNLYRPKPEIYKNKNFIDYRGANDNLFVSSSDHHQHLHHVNHQPISVPVFSVPLQMPFIQVPYGAFPVQIQLSTPTNQMLFPQPEATTFRYQTQLIGLTNHQQSPYNPYLPLNVIPTNKPKLFKESERHTMNYFSPADPVFHPQQLRKHPNNPSNPSSTAEAPIQPTTYSPRINNYGNIIRPQIKTPARSTASSSIQINKFVQQDDDDFKPMFPSYDVRKHNQFRYLPKGSTTTEKPDSINAQLYSSSENITIPYVTLPTQVSTTISTNEVNQETNYEIVMGRPKSTAQKFNEKSSEKPVLKWTPKKQRNKVANVTLPSLPTLTTPTPPTTNSFLPTLPPIDETTPISTRLTTAHIFRGRNRFNKRNSSSTHVRGATISPQSTTKLNRKKSSTASVAGTQPPFAATSIFPTYITPVQSTDEPITSQSYSTSISLEVNGERVADHFDRLTTTPGYELIPVGVESINTNRSNVKLFKASVVPEKFDDLTFSILNHAKTIEDGKDAH